MTRYSLSAVLTLFIAFAFSAVAPVYAQPPATPATAPASDDDDEKLRPLEPDFSLVNLPTTLPLPVHAGNFHLTHRFNENLRNDDFGTQLSNLFGLDEGATIQLEYRFGLMKHVEAIVSRTNVQRDIQMGVKYDAFHEGESHPFGLSALVSIEGTNNFRENYAPALGLVLSRTLGDVAAVYATPVWAHNTLPTGTTTQDTTYIGLGARVKLMPGTYVVFEASPRLGGYVAGDAEFAFSIEKRVGAHLFSLAFSNTSATTYGQIARGGNPHSLYFGFNLARKFF